MTRIVEMSNSINYLIVDDSDFFRETITQGLKSFGFSVIYQATTFNMALEYLKLYKVQFIICELSISGNKGFDLLREVRDSDLLFSIPFLMMSGEINKKNIALLAEYEVDGYLLKPFSLNGLAEKIPLCFSHYNDPKNKEYHFELAKSLLKKKDYAGAFNLYSLLARKHSNSARTLVGLARCYRGLKNYLRAEDCCKKAMEKNDIYVQAYDEMGRICLEKELIDEAVFYFKKATQLSPSNPLRYEVISEVLLDRQRFKEAEYFLEEATVENALYEKIYEQYGKALFYQRKLAKAISFFEKALQYSPGNRSLTNLMGVCLKDSNRYEEALNYYNLAIKIYPDDTKVLYNKALCYYEMQKYVEAKRVCEIILSIDPNHEKAIKRIKLIESRSK